MNLPTKRNIVEVDMPVSEYDKIIQEEFKSPVIRFLKHYINILVNEENDEDVIFIKTTRLYEEFKDFCKENYIETYQKKLTGFSMEIAKYNIKGIGTPETKYFKEEKKEYRCYVINPNIAFEELKNK